MEKMSCVRMGSTAVCLCGQHRDDGDTSVKKHPHTHTRTLKRRHQNPAACQERVLTRESNSCAGGIKRTSLEHLAAAAQSHDICGFVGGGCRWQRWRRWGGGHFLIQSNGGGVMSERNSAETADRRLISGAN